MACVGKCFGLLAQLAWAPGLMPQPAAAKIGFRHHILRNRAGRAFVGTETHFAYNYKAGSTYAA